jgi:Glycosyl hydrolases family 16
MHAFRGRARHRLRRPGLPMTFAAVALGGVLLASMTGSAEAGGYSSMRTAHWQAIWRDDFAGSAGAAPGTAWRVDLGHSYPGGPDRWGTGEVQAYTADPENLAQDGRGHLRITATRDASGEWRSARIETVRDDFAPAPGGRLRIEARIQLPTGGAGYWPAFWGIGAPYRTDPSTWPGVGELDVMENINNQRVVHGTLHCGEVTVGGPCHEDVGLTGEYRLRRPAGRAGFHTYTVVWGTAPARLDWYVDGRPYWSVTADQVGAAVWQAAFGHGYFLLVNLAIGGGWPGPPGAATLPGGSMLVDYVAVFRSATAVTRPPRDARAGS